MILETGSGHLNDNLLTEPSAFEHFTSRFPL